MSSAVDTPAARAREFAAHSGYSVESTLAENPRKGTGVYRAVRGGKQFVMKCAGNGAPEGVRVALRAETEFYERRSIPVVPALADAAEGVLVLHHVRGVPLRTLVSSSALDDHALSDVLGCVRSALDSLYEGCRGTGTATTFEIAFRHLRSLARSGPRGIPAPWLARRLAGRAAEWRLRPRLSSAIAHGVADFLPSAFAHGDLHYDNVLVDPADGAVWFVDFELHDRTSPFDVDLIYLYAMTEKALGRRPRVAERWRDLFRDALARPACDRICAVFRAAAAVNPRFAD